MESKTSNFLRAQIAVDREAQRYETIITRFPPEPNGYLHIGHSKSICVNFGLAAENGGRCHLRFDDTNPTKENQEYVDAIMADIRWLGFDWGEHLYFASDYFPQLYDWAVEMVRRGEAYVDSLSEAEIREYRGTVTEPGKPSPYRDRPTEESLQLLDEMRRGVHPEGSHVLRAKGDLASPNMKLRDPLMYRILHAHHHRTGNTWHIYPMYDYAHGLSDAIEGISHSVCTLEFDNNRALYDLFLDRVGFEEPRPHQYEMARLVLPYTMLSKRYLLRVVQEGIVDGWDDPRMPTLSALRNRGVPAAAVRNFVERVGVSKAASVVDPVLFDNAIRDELNPVSKRMMAVLDPLPVKITNWPGGTVWLDASLYPHDVPLEGSRRVPFTGNLLIEREDFRETANKKYKRLVIGREIRLRYGFFITATGVEKDAEGNITAVLATYDPETRGGAAPDGRSPSGTIHWVSQDEGKRVPVRIYERLFDHPAPDTLEDPTTALNPDSCLICDAWVEPAVLELAPEAHVQFERLGYFWAHPARSNPGAPDFVRVVPLKDGFKEAPVVAEPVQQAPVEQKVGERVFSDEAQVVLDALLAVGVPQEEAAALAGSPERHALYTQVAASIEPALAAKWVVHEVARLENTGSLTADHLVEVIQMVESGTLTNRLARDLLTVLGAEGGDPAAIVEARGWKTLDDDSALIALVQQVFAANPTELAEWRGGKDRLTGFFVGKVMKASRGTADARKVQELLQAQK